MPAYIVDDRVDLALRQPDKIVIVGDEIDRALEHVNKRILSVLQTAGRILITFTFRPKILDQSDPNRPKPPLPGRISNPSMIAGGATGVEANPKPTSVPEVAV